MAYDSPDGRRRDATRRSQGRVGDNRGIARGPVTSQGRRPAQARGGSANQYRSSRGYQGVGSRNGGYNLRQHNIRFNDRRGGTFSRIASNPRAIVALAVLVFLVILLVFGVSSCVRGCSRTEEGSTASSQDVRVAAGLSADLTDKLIARLDQDALMASIAAQASKIEDERLVELALKESEAVPLVAGLLDENADHSPRPYGSEASRGAYPKLYTWDQRWGYMSFGDGALALTGSGPTSLAMAYIGLTGATDRTPADFAGKAAQAGKLDETYGMTVDFVKSEAHELGLKCEEVESSGEVLTDVIESGTVVLVQAKAGTFGDEAHWMLVVGENLDGSVNLNDPTSPTNTARPWDPKTVATAAQSMHSLTVSSGEEEEVTDGGEGDAADGAATEGEEGTYTE